MFSDIYLLIRIDFPSFIAGIALKRKPFLLPLPRGKHNGLMIMDGTYT